jgi:hypothetical protein
MEQIEFKGIIVRCQLRKIRGPDAWKIDEHIIYDYDVD